MRILTAFTAALLLSAPASAEMTKADVEKIVRDYLLDDTEALLAEAWPDRCRISPDDTGRAVILSACEFGA